ncbi:MAG: DUF885 domain-containing protein [Weeksellaceae bacterium]|nr:DUF885 domain-containing protein [Weeksellaceae bacterium]
MKTLIQLTLIGIGIYGFAKSQNYAANYNHRLIDTKIFTEKYHQSISDFKNSNKSIDADAEFDNFKNNFIKVFLKQFPQYALYSGLHDYDATLGIPDTKSRENDIQFAKNYLKKLNAFSLNQLNDLNKIDYHLIENQLNQIIWSYNELKDWQWNPSSYNVGEQFAMILSGQHTSLENRLKDLGKKAIFVSNYYEAAKKNIDKPVEVLQNLAISQNKGSLETFEKSIPDSIKVSKLSETEKQSILKNTALATQAIKNYIAWLESYKPAERRDFRLGEKLYQQKFGFDIQSSFSAKALYDYALKRKIFIHGEMAKLAKQLWTKYYGNAPLPDSDQKIIRKVLDTLSSQHSKPEEFQATIEKQLPELVKFINEKNLLYLDPNKPLVVRKEPAYMAGVAGASISSPGPFESNANTYYNVGSLEGWSAEDKESYLREYNNYMLQILNIHEAIPGHYTQLVYSNKSPSIIKSIFGNGSMVEGWAVYGEQMMLENGYGNNAPEMWLVWYKWNLRSVCNTILDYSVHTQNMSKEDALKLLIDDAFQEKQEAEGKWRRVSVTSVQLTSYYNGYQEIINLRDKIKERNGKNFSLKNFNEKFLSYGSSPVKYISQIML